MEAKKPLGQYALSMVADKVIKQRQVLLTHNELAGVSTAGFSSAFDMGPFPKAVSDTRVLRYCAYTGRCGPKIDQAALKRRSSSLFTYNMLPHEFEGTDHHLREWWHVEDSRL